MRRRHLKAIAKRVVEEVESSPERWRSRTDYPITREERTDGGKEIQIEVDVLEETEEGLRLGVSASSGGFIFIDFPVARTTII